MRTPLVRRGPRLPALCVVVVLTLLLVAGRWHPQRLFAQADGLGSHIHEQGPSWTGDWTRRAGTTTWDGSYNGGTGQPTVMTVTRSGNTVTAVRTVSGDGNFCTYQGTVAADGRTVNGHATCSRSGTDFDFTLTLLDVSAAAPTAPAPTAPPSLPTGPHVLLSVTGGIDDTFFTAGDTITWCIAATRAVRLDLVDNLADGTRQVLQTSWFFPASTTICQGIPVNADRPPGEECLQLDEIESADQVTPFTQQACFIVY